MNTTAPASTHHPSLTAGQRALLEAALVQRQHGLQQQLALHHEGHSRAEHAASLLAVDAHDAAQHEGAREVDQALSDRLLVELGAVGQALRQVHEAGFGQCQDCGEDISFDRLKVEPWAHRCLACATAAEQARPRGTRTGHR